MVRHVDVGDWERVPVSAELDVVGPVARAALARHGLVSPFNARTALYDQGVRADGVA